METPILVLLGRLSAKLLLRLLPKRCSHWFDPSSEMGIAAGLLLLTLASIALALAIGTWL